WVEEQSLEPVRLPQRAARNRRGDPPIPPIGQALDQRRQRAFLAVVGEDRLAQISRGRVVECHRRMGGIGERKSSAFDPPKRAQALGELALPEEMLIGWKGQISAALAVFETPLQVGPKLLARALQGYRIIEVEQ